MWKVLLNGRQLVVKTGASWWAMGVRFVYLPPSLHRCVSPAETDRL